MKYSRFLVLLVFITNALSSYAQSKYEISGIITDSETGEKLVGVTIYDVTSKKGTVTNKVGYYSLELSKGNYKLLYSYLGYNNTTKNISLSKNTTLNISLQPSAEQIDEVVVSTEAPDHNIRSAEVSVEKLSMKQIERIPVIMGETDIMKTIQLLSGITSISEGQSGYVVRGSGFDQNLILMDDMPIYYSSHMQGLFSVFNSDAVDGLTVYKGGTPARFGGRGASVLDVRMRESGFDQYRAGLSIGLITSKFSIEAPVVKDKLSIFIGGRSTKLGLGYMYDQYNARNSETTNVGKGGKDGSGGKGGDTDYAFFAPSEYWWDMNAKIIYKMNDNNRLYLSGYYGQDHALTAAGDTDWGNRAASLRWSHDFNSKLTSNTSLIHSRYYTHGDGGLYIFNSGITTNSIKQEFSWFANEKHEVRFGFQSEYQNFNHGELEDTDAGAGKFMPSMQDLESALYIDNNQKITNK